MLGMILSGSLPASRTFELRSWAWVPAPAGVGYRGTLTIAQGRHERRAEVDTYLVDELPAEGFPGRRFVLANQGDATPWVYEVGVHQNGQDHVCEGGEGWCGRGPRCKHREAVAALLAEGAFDGCCRLLRQQAAEERGRGASASVPPPPPEVLPCYAPVRRSR